MRPPGIWPAAGALLLLAGVFFFLPAHELRDHYGPLRAPATPADVYTYAPRELAGAEVQALYPAHLTLRLVQVVHRHGERSPTHHHFQSLERFKAGWPLCNSPGQERFFLDANASGTSDFRLRVLGDDGLPLAPTPGLCSYGQLTDKGKQALYRVGAFLRHLYVQHLQFLPEDWAEPEDVYVRATDHIRTHHSALSLLLGLYPLPHRTPGLALPTIHTMPLGKEYLYPSDNCPQQLKLWVAEMETDDALAGDVDRLRLKYPPVAEWMDMYPKPTSRDVWSATPLQAVHDTFTVMLAHWLALPAGVTTSAIDDLEKVLARQFYRPYQQSEPLQRLVSGRLLRDLGRHLDAAVGGAVHPRFVEYSTHDTTVAPLLCALGVWDGRWPPYASTVVVELLEDTSKKVCHQGAPEGTGLVFSVSVRDVAYAQGRTEAGPGQRWLTPQ